MSVAQRLEALGITLPPVFSPVGNYVGCVVVGDMAHVGGHGPSDGTTVITGKVGGDISLSEARDAARTTALSILATLQAELGDLDRIRRIVKVFGMVNVARGFNQTPAVIAGSHRRAQHGPHVGSVSCDPTMIDHAEAEPGVEVDVRR